MRSSPIVLATRASAPLITIDALSVCRNGRLVLRDVSMVCPTGSITAVVGASGVGKSTLINSINGLLTPSAGRIELAPAGHGSGPTALRELRRRSATVFQEHALIGRLHALDNVLLGLADSRHPLSLLPWSRAQRERAAIALHDVGLLARAYNRVDQLSGGERQRVGIARALVRRPELLLGDEPFASVDARLASELAALLRRLVAQHGLTAIVVLHQLQLARSLADHIVGLADGRVVFDGPATTFDGTAEARVFHCAREEKRRHVS
ncbi:MAG: ATP-binding cassette domain-containing protein [Polyangiales bacterium]